jgi:hypothetical protein
MLILRELHNTGLRQWLSCRKNFLRHLSKRRLLRAELLNVTSNGGSGCVSVADNLSASYLGSIADTMSYFQAFAVTAPAVATAFADPTSWVRCPSLTLGSAAAAWSEVTGRYTFHDLALRYAMELERRGAAGNDPAPKPRKQPPSTIT